MPILLLLMLAGLANASVEIAGSVQDPAGAAIAGATVTLSDAAGIPPVTTATDLTGRFRFAGLPSGAYQLRVESTGFKAGVVKLKLGTKQPTPLRIMLSIADLKEEITVSGETGRLSTEAGENVDTVALDRKAMRGLPILGNDIIGAASELLSSAALGTGGASIVVDGMETSETGVTASAIQEVRINQNPYSAEYSRPGRSRIEVITKAGTKEFHGEFNFLFRDSIFDARNAFAEERPQERRKIFEGNLTGPAGKGGRSSFVISGNHEEENLQSLVFALTPSGQVRANVPQPQRQNEWNGKYSRQIGNAHTIALRYEFQDESVKAQNVGGFNLEETAADFTNRQHHLYFNYRGSLTPHLVHEFALRGGRHNANTISRLRGQPSIVVLDSFTGGGAQADQRSTENHVQFTDTTLWTRGKHMVKFGLSVPDWSRRGSSDHTNADGTFYFSSLADYQRQTPYSYAVQRGDGYLALWQKEVGLFVQDDFKLRPNLSLSAGLRYDWQNHLSDHNNFAPRFALAWAPDKSRKMVLRGGAGIFYDRTGERPIADILRFDGYHLLRLLLSNPGYPNPLPPGAALESQPANLVRFAPGLRAPYLAQWSFGAERQLSKALALSATYTAVRGIKMFRSLDRNAPAPPLYAGRPDPAIGTLREIEGSGRLASQSLDLGLRGSLTRHFKGQAQYTYASAWNDTGGISALPADSHDLSREWAHAPFDMRHRFSLMGVLRPEKLFNLGVRATLNTGTPYGLTTGRDDNRDGIAADRPAGVARNSMRGFGSANLDFRWTREFRLTKDAKDDGPAVALNVDAFNVLNHVNYTTVVGNMMSPYFGLPTAAKAARRIQLGLQFKF